MNLDFMRSALIAIDVQNDFCPGYTRVSGEKRPAGALAVNEGDRVIKPLNSLGKKFAQNGGTVIASADWHPPAHVSFASAHQGMQPGAILGAVKDQVLWPDHCVQGTEGACFHDHFDLRPVNLILRKGFRQELDSYSAFFENDRKTPTGLDGFLQSLSIDTLLLGGLATDYCVLYSALDAVRRGYKTIVLIDAVQGVGYPQGSVERALDAMREAGVLLVDSEHCSG